jgi:molybdopterin converting factor small subunit
MQIQVGYYAILREQRGLDREILQVESSDLRQLYRNLFRSHALSLGEKHVRPAINDEFCDWDRPLAEGDFVVFVPPVAGG